MDIDRNNFSKVLYEIFQSKLVERSDVISLDLEFTGLRFDNNDKERPEDFIFERYEKMRVVAMRYNIIQLGMTFFIREENNVMAYPFNFYLFPRGYKNINPVVSLQSSTIEFNSKNGMDWNKWIRDGITYVQLDKIMESVSVPEKASFEELEKKLTEEQREEFEIIRGRLKEFIDKEGDQEQIETSSTFLRLVIQKYIQKYHNQLYLEPYIQDSPLKEKLLLLIKKVDNVSRAEIQNEIKLKITGFTSLFEKIWKSNTKIVGHNSFFDLLYIYQSFVADLPFEYFKFKQEINKGFPNYYDTKYISQLSQFDKIFENGTTLMQLQKQILIRSNSFNKFSIKLHEKFGAYDWNNNNAYKFHEAGFDSYLTGWIFYHLIGHLQSYQQHKNILKLIRSNYDIVLNTPNDIYSETSLIFVCPIKKPNTYITNLFQYKRKKVQASLQLIKSVLTNDKYTSQEVKLREIKVDYIFIQLKSQLKRKQFITDIYTLKHKQLQICTVASYIRDRKNAIQKSK